MSRKHEYAVDLLWTSKKTNNLDASSLCAFYPCLVDITLLQMSSDSLFEIDPSESSLSDTNAVHLISDSSTRLPKMSNAATTNTSIPITKMVNDLFLQWLSLPDTRSTLYTALHSVQTNSKMPEPINYPKVRVYFSCHLHRVELARQCHWDRWIFSVKRRWRDISHDDFYRRVPIDWNCSRCSLDLYNTWRWILQTTTFRFTSCFSRPSNSV